MRLASASLGREEVHQGSVKADAFAICAVSHVVGSIAYGQLALAYIMLNIMLIQRLTVTRPYRRVSIVLVVTHVVIKRS